MEEGITPNRTEIVCGAGLVLALLTTVLVYLPALPGGFYFDDEPNIVHVAAVQWDAVSLDAFTRLLEEGNLRRRWFANLTFALNHVVSGLDPTAFRVVNIAIHLANGVLVFLVARSIGRWANGASEGNAIAALVAASIFLLHPLNIQAVSYVVQRMASLATLFSLLALLAYLGARIGPRRRSLAGLGIVSWGLAVSCKETALALPGVIVILEYAFAGDLWRKRLTGYRSLLPDNRIGWLVLAGLLLFALVAYWYGKGVISLSEPFPNRDFNGWERLLTETRVQWSYLALFFWPDPASLNLDHQVEVSRSLWHPLSTLPATGFLAILVLASLSLLRKCPRYGAPLSSYLLLHVIESGPINLELMFEHRMYLPSVFLAMFLGTLAMDARKRWGGRSLVAVLPFVALLALNTHARNTTWGDPLAILADSARKSPLKYRPQYNYGTELGKRGLYGDAEIYFLKAIEIDQSSSEAHNQLGNVYLLTGRADEAFRLYEYAVELDEKNAEALFNLGEAYFRAGKSELAADAYGRFLEVAPPYLNDVRNIVRQRLGAL